MWKTFIEIFIIYALIALLCVFTAVLQIHSVIDEGESFTLADIWIELFIWIFMLGSITTIFFINLFF